MRERTFGSTDLQATELGIDVGALTVGQGDDAAGLLSAALDAGITFFDADPTAGADPDGRAELLLGRAIRGVRDELTIATRCGYEVVAPWDRPGVRELRHDWSVAALNRALDRSLTRLRTEPVDLWQLHHPGMAELEADDLFGFLDEQVAKGKIRRYGVLLGPGPGWLDEGVAAVRDRAAAAVQTVYNAIDQDPGRELLRAAAGAGAGVIAAAPVGPALDRPADRRLERLDFLTRDRDQTLAQALLRFVLDDDAVTTALLAPASGARLAELVAATQRPSLTDEDLARIAELRETGFGPA